MCPMANFGSVRHKEHLRYGVLIVDVAYEGHAVHFSMFAKWPCMPCGPCMLCEDVRHVEHVGHVGHVGHVRTRAMRVSAPCEDVGHVRMWAM
jgi:hypothetical protein